MVNLEIYSSHSSPVPDPVVGISLSRDNNILAGSPLTMSCDVDVNDQVDTSVSVNIEWTVSGSPLTSNDRITVGAINQTGFNQYRSQVTFSTLSSTHDSGEYICTISVISGEGCMYVEDAEVVEVFTALSVTSELITTIIWNKAGLTM